MATATNATELLQWQGGLSDSGKNGILGWLNAIVAGGPGSGIIDKDYFNKYNQFLGNSWKSYLQAKGVNLDSLITPETTAIGQVNGIFDGIRKYGWGETSSLKELNDSFNLILGRNPTANEITTFKSGGKMTTAPIPQTNPISVLGTSSQGYTPINTSNIATYSTPSATIASATPISNISTTQPITSTSPTSMGTIVNPLTGKTETAISATKNGETITVPISQMTMLQNSGWIVNVSAAKQTDSTAPTTPAPAITTSNLAFKDGLTDTQKTQLQNRLNAIKAGSPITQTDINNFNYGLGSSWQSSLGVNSSDITTINSQLQPTVNPPIEQNIGMDFSNLPPEILNSEDWINASDQNKAIFSAIYKASQAVKTGDVALIQDYNDALDKAMAAADPYFKQKLLFAQDEITRSVGKVEGDYQSQLKSSQDKIKSIEEDLTFNKDYMTLEQQADLSNQLRQYKSNLYNTQQSMAESGLAFSSPRARAEEELSTDYQGSVESLNRRYNKSQRDLQVGSARDVAALQQNVADLERSKTENLTAIQRTGEETLGTVNAPSVPGVNPLGNFTGTLEYEKGREIDNLANQYRNYANPLTT